MSFNNYYCDLENDDCFAIIPYHSSIEKNGHMDQYKFIDILVFCKKLIFRIYEINDKHAVHHASQPRDLHKIHLYITFTIEENLFNNQIIVDLYGITPNKDNIWDIKMYPEYNNEIIKNIKDDQRCWSINDVNRIKDVTYSKQTIQNSINLNKYDFESYFINYHNYHNNYEVKYKTQTSSSYEVIISLDTILVSQFYGEKYRDVKQYFSDRTNLKNVLIYKLYHLCKDLRERHTKKEIYYATLEDKMAEMQTEMRIKDTYTEETEQIRRDILEYKEKCVSYVKSIEELQKKCLTLEMSNIELEKKCNSYELSTNIHIEDISKELKLLCKSIESMKQVSNSNF